jgi:hypothetical protein
MVGHALADYEWAGAYIKWANITRNAHISSCKQWLARAPSKGNGFFAMELASWSLEKDCYIIRPDAVFSIEKIGEFKETST